MKKNKTFEPTDVMIDLETLATNMRPVILSIGAVAFNMHDSIPKKETEWVFYQVVSIKSQKGRTQSLDTINWWGTQPKEAQRVLPESQKTLVTLDTGLVRLSEWCASLGPTIKRVWSNGAAFDIPILDQAYFEKTEGAMGGPWHYRMPRDTKTLFDWYPRPSKIRTIMHSTTRGPLHHALYDAMRQAKAVQLVWKHLREMTGIKEPRCN